jgi:hypothetical protein
VARLYNFCTYNGIDGGRYQSESWDVLCDDWNPEPTPNPINWECTGPPGITWNCSDLTNPQAWACAGLPPAGNWECDTDIAPAVYQPIILKETVWNNRG